MRTQSSVRGIAVIGLAARFPGARDVQQFWLNLCDGREAIATFSERELVDAGIPSEVLHDSRYVAAKGTIDDGECFDASFFGMSPKEAELTDPQQRVFLECAWHALEDAGCIPQHYHGRIGVFAGSNLNTYLFWNLRHAMGQDGAGPTFEARIGNDKDYLTTRVSYKLGLTGPSVAVQTACSTSLVAVHLACRSLMSGECEMALAGAASIAFPQKRGYWYEKDGMYPADGHCRPFDASSEGCPDGDGVGVVVLKPLDQALADGDHVYAVIRGSAINNDGSSKVGFTAPSVDRQAAVIKEAHAAADISPESVGYVETHGTGTPLGDLIEVSALTEAFRAGTDMKGYCAIGSVKSNIGHLNVASGMAGLIKTVLCLHHKKIPATLHFHQPNPHLALVESPFFVAREMLPWNNGSMPRRAGVSSFGIGGTNTHVVLEEYQAPPVQRSRDSWELLPLAARSAPALDMVTSSLAQWLRDKPELDLSDVAHTLRVGRRAFDHRRVVVCRKGDDIVSVLHSQEPTRVLIGTAKRRDGSVVFMFPGLGDHYVGMAHGLYRSERTFREIVDYCCQRLETVLGVDLRTVLHPATAVARADVDEAAQREGIDLRRMLRRRPGLQDAVDSTLNRTPYAHSALFVVEFALANLLMTWGIQPTAMIGYSIGEYVAATLAGVIGLEDALGLVARRALLIEQLPRGAMLAVALSADKTQRFLVQGLYLSAFNGPNLSVVSGPVNQISELEQELSRQDVITRRLSADYPFHSKLMEPIAAEFTAMIREIEFRRPKIPFLSNVTGTWIANDEATNAQYWGRHMSHPVRFAQCVDEVVKGLNQVLIEVGPGNALSSIVLQRPKSTDDRHVAVPCMRHRYEQQDDTPYLLRAVGRLWLGGIDVDWNAFGRRNEKRRVSLPGYPFERNRYALEARRPIESEQRTNEALVKKKNISDWFYIPSWRRALPSELCVSDGADPGATRLIFADEGGLGVRLAESARSAGRSVVCVSPGASWESRGDGRFVIDPDRAEHYDELFDRLSSTKRFPHLVAHLWPLNMPGRDKPGGSVAGYSTLSLIARALARFPTHPLHLSVVTTGVHAVTGVETLDPHSALLLGACKVIPQELPHVTCAHFDIDQSDYAETAQKCEIDALATELQRPGDFTVALRHGFRWTRTFEPVRLGLKSPGDPPLLRERGVYLITGGFGAIGLTLAEHLARTVRARLVLTGRSSVPERDRWTEWLASHSEDNETSDRIRRIQSIERVGGEVLPAVADVCDLNAMAAVVREAKERFGAVNGVIHAAGAGGGTLIQLASPELTEGIFRPKVMGALVLDGLFADGLDFFILCSSVSSLMGGIGQSDHSAANAFLDTFAHWRTKSRSSRTIAVNWDSWQLAGLAHRAAQAYSQTGRVARQRTRIKEGLFEQFEVDAQGRFLFLATLGPSRQWVIDEHRVLGRALLPGTGYIEMICEAARHLEEPGELEIHDLVFMFPMFFEDSQDLSVRLTIERAGDAFSFMFASSVTAKFDDMPSWRNHASGKLCFVPAGPAPRHNIGAFLASTEADEVDASVPENGALYFGPRWQNLKKVRCGERRSWALLELPVSFQEETDKFLIHPALLDIATSFGIQGHGFYMVLSYKKLRFRAPLAPRIYSLLLSPRESYSEGDIATFDLAITDLQGRELVAVEGLVLRRISDAGERMAGWINPCQAPPQMPAAEVKADPGLSDASQANPLHGHLAQGILPEEGCAVFDRVLTTSGVSQVIVSTADLVERMKSMDAYTMHSLLPESVRVQSPGAPQHRPELGTPFAAPRHDLDQRLVKAIQDLLGIQSVGIDDNFFDLGGDSLRGIQLVNRLRNEFSIDVSLRSLYAVPTVRALSDGASSNNQAGK